MNTAKKDIESTPDVGAVGIESTALLCFLRGKLTDAGTALRSREQMEESWRTGSEEDWRSAARMCGGKLIGKADRLTEAAKHARIAIKCRHDVEMFRTVIAALDKHNKQI